jgi:hypothetical protein
VKARFNKAAVALATTVAVLAGSTTAIAYEAPVEQTEIQASSSSTDAADSTASQVHATAFDEAMDAAIESEDTADEMATPQWPAAAGRAAWQGAKWVGKQVASGALKEWGKQLING